MIFELFDGQNFDQTIHHPFLISKHKISYKTTVVEMQILQQHIISI